MGAKEISSRNLYYETEGSLSIEIWIPRLEPEATSSNLGQVQSGLFVWLQEHEKFLILLQIPVCHQRF